MSAQGASGASNPKQGKKRKHTFTSAECNLLVNLVEQNLETLRGQFSSTVTNAKKKKLWETITSQINSLGYEKRTPVEVREKWRNMTQIAKKTNSGIMQSQRKTGGSPAAKPLATTTEKIISLLSDEPSFSGIQGGFESGVSCDSGKFMVILSISVYFPDKLNSLVYSKIDIKLGKLRYFVYLYLFILRKY